MSSSARRNEKTADDKLRHRLKKLNKKDSSGSSTQPSFSSSSGSSGSKSTSASGSGSGSGSYSGSGSRSRTKKSTAKATKTRSGYESENVQEVEVEENKPGLYKRIACIRYVRPMMGYDCWGGPMAGGNCYGGYNPYSYGGYAGEFPLSTRALIIPPRPKILYRPAREEDFAETDLKSVNVCASFLKIHVPCKLDCWEDEKPSDKKPANKITNTRSQTQTKPPPTPKPRPPPPPPPTRKSKPKIDKSKIIKRYLSESKSKIPQKKKDHKIEKSKRKSRVKPPPSTPKPPPPKESEVKPPPPRSQEEKRPPPTPIQSKPISQRPTVMPNSHASSSASSVKSAQDKYHFEDNDVRDQHYDTDLKRRGSSFDAVAQNSYQVQNQNARDDAVAPKRKEAKGNVRYKELAAAQSSKPSTISHGQSTKTTDIDYWVYKDKIDLSNTTV